jgi:hypothetical protein
METCSDNHVIIITISLASPSLVFVQNFEQEIKRGRVCRRQKITYEVCAVSFLLNNFQTSFCQHQKHANVIS